ncbi:MAG: permease-like cell division protein FtsX [Xanthomonadales bacterium]|nr:permease-like cell division protein FtsX [Xanthomonadales bacterium]MDH3924019.1 permease-like cell division protein FtsX [Xanthomonadales bacterium]MDH3939369.1 permease-like cell division protein FtsX [Xanthomonadales bacterium]MDH4000855.1 permease-like cell division protein FtsX [Xanthomonadales bacterium]
MSLSGVRRRSRSWGRRQLFSLFSSLGTLLSHRVGTLMTVMVLGIAMALPIGLYITVKNLHALDLQQEQWGNLTVFLKTNVGEQQARALQRTIDQEPGARAEAISPEAGMEQFRQASGFGQALDMFEENPLPWVIVVTPEPAEGEELQTVVLRLEAWLQQREETDLVQVDFKWLQRLAGLLELGDALVSVLTVLFSLAAVVVISNTIRMDVANRSEEIQVLSLVGAGNGFIRQPFLYSGFWYGLLGALLALLLFNLCLYFISQPLERLLDAYGNSFTVVNLGVGGFLFVLLCGGLLGFIGAWISVQRYLNQINSSGSLARF